MGITSSSLDGENTTLDVQKRHIESTTTEIVDQDIPLLVGLARAETIGNSSGSRLIDDTENVQPRNGSSILGRLPLVVVEVGWNSDDGLLDLLAELDLSDFLHLCNMSAMFCKPATEGQSQTYLAEDHGGDLLRGEGLGLTQIIDLDEGIAVPVDDLEGPGLDILLDRLIVKPATDETPKFAISIDCPYYLDPANSLDIEDGVCGVHRSLILCSLADETLLGGEGNE